MTSRRAPSLASFQRTLLSFDSPYDRYRHGGQPAALSAAAKRGEELFFGERQECYYGHGGFSFTDDLKHAHTPFGDISEAEIADLVAFLGSLTDPGFLRDPRHGGTWPVPHRAGR